VFLRKLFFVLAFFVFLAFTGLFAQSKVDSTETTSSVPELIAFHDVIYVIWHEAYPAKDIKALKDMVEKIKPYMEKINSAALPGILRDKESKWKDGLKVLNSSAENYYSAAAGNDDGKMLEAAEQLHSNFEMMVRVLRPVNKEVDEYHKVLYVIFHKYYPVKDYASIKTVIDDLIAKAEACTTTKLSKRLESKTEMFQKTASELVEKTKALKEALASNDSAAIDKAVDTMHSKYQDLEKIFD
jgi:hypothetical protein